MAFVFSLITFVTMQKLYFSFIIPVFNRPEEIKELLDSFLKLKGGYDFEIVIVEDGSTNTCKTIIDNFKAKLNISYYFKENTGPGDSRNFGMHKAKGNYFIILDSDIILPSNYLKEVKSFLNRTYYDCYGGPDAAHITFSNLQKAINLVMTSFIITGGIRGGKQQLNNFQPRSFNMGLSKKAFQDSGGFGNIHPGEDPDLSLRLKQLGYKTILINNAFVYHKRRISWFKFYNQVHKFGLVRPILNKWHPHSKSVVYWFPTFFMLGFIVSMTMLYFKIYFPMYLYGIYFTIVFVIALVSAKNISIAWLSLIAISIQFFAYGYGFLKSTLTLLVLRKTPEKAFPSLFF